MKSSTTPAQPIDDGEPAFPVLWGESPGNFQSHPGMSLRDYFAGKALRDLGGVIPFPSWGPMTQESIDWLATNSYAVADAMLKARKTQPTEE